MSSLLFTLAIAFLIVLISIGLLAIGWLITGKARIRAGACGRDPTKKQDEKEGCGTSINCQLCDQNKEPPKKDNVKLP